MINENKIINNKIMLKMSEFFMTTTGYVETKEKWKYDNYSLICVLKNVLNELFIGFMYSYIQFRGFSL